MCLEHLYTMDWVQFLHEYQKNVSISECVWVCVYTIGSFCALTRFFLHWLNNIPNLNKTLLLLSDYPNPYLDHHLNHFKKEYVEHCQTDFKMNDKEKIEKALKLIANWELKEYSKTGKKMRAEIKNILES